MKRYAASPEEVADRYPALLSERRFDLWAGLFDPAAVLVRVEAGTATRIQSLADSMPEQIEYGAENRQFVETWKHVSIVRNGNLAVITARYSLEVDQEIRRGIDILTLAGDDSGWRIVTLAYEQLALVCK